MPETNIDPEMRLARPRTHEFHRLVSASTLSREGIEQLVLPYYAFEGSADTTFFHRGINDTYLVSAGDRKLALKIYRLNWRSREAIAAELSALQHLMSRGINVVTPIARRDGDLITAILVPEGLRMAVLFNWIDGQTPRFIQPSHAIQFGKALAGMHNATDGFPPNAERPKIDLNYMLEESVTAIRSRLGKMPALAARLEALAARVRATWNVESPRLQDWGFCHGDITEVNARLDGDRCVLLDFDFCGSGWRVFDLASYRWRARTSGMDGAAWNAFLQAYSRVRPAADEQLVALFVILRHLWHTGQCVVLSEEMGASIIADTFFENALSFCEEVGQESLRRS